jgi:hypothetical protein
MEHGPAECVADHVGTALLREHVETVETVETVEKGGTVHHEHDVVELDAPGAGDGPRLKLRRGLSP